MENTIQDRRHFLRKLATGAAAMAALPVLAAEKAHALPPFPAVADEAYWESVKAQFAVPADKVMMNAANLCPAPSAVTSVVTQMMTDLNKDVSFQFRDRFTAKRKQSLEAIAGFLGVAKEEIGITRNTSEGNNAVVNGLDLGRGDDVVIWDENHYSNGVAWEERGKRMGFTVRRIKTPEKPASVKALVELFASACLPQTKVLAFSHLSNLTGLLLPAKELCAMARSRNIMTLVDGAQTFGMIPLDLHDMGCDFFTASTHKWLMGPFENGVLYVKSGRLAGLWPSLVTAGWKAGSTTVDEKLCILGQRNETTPYALPEAIAFQRSIGVAEIGSRVKELNSHLRAGIRKEIPSAVLVTPEEFSAGITVVNFPGKDTREIYQRLYDQFGIASAPTGGIRLSPHVYNTKADIDKVVKALKSLAV